MSSSRLLSQCTKLAFAAGTPHLDLAARDGTLPAAAVKRDVQPLLTDLPERADAQLVTATALVSHDHVETALRLIDKRDDIPARYIRGLILRRQGDYAGACKEFRATIGWPCLLVLGERLSHDSMQDVQRVLASFNNLVVGGAFNPTPMCGIVQQVCQGGHQSLYPAICQVQQLELTTLLGWFLGIGHRKALQLEKQKLQA